MRKEPSTKAEIIAAATAAMAKLDELINEPPAEANEPQFLSLKDAARLAGVSKFTVSRWVKKGVLPMIKLSSSRQGSVLIEKADIINLMRRLKTQTGKGSKK